MEYTDIELKNEKWKDIAGYDGMYQVSDLGRVRSLKFGKVRVLRPQKNNNGYLIVGLYKDGKRKGITVHRLVANAFIPNDDESKTQINHINEDKSENKVSNLEWCSAQYNVTYNDLQFRKKNSVRSKLEKLYRPDLSSKENIKLFKDQGIECCRDTIWKIRKDLGLIESQPVRSKIKKLYDKNLTYKQNLEIFMANGIECCRDTVRNLRKELGLTN